MRISGSVLFLLSLTACGVSDETATAVTPVIATCPTRLTSQTPLPAGARVLGKVPETLILWDAEVSAGEPSEVGEDRALGTMEQTDEGPLPGKRYLYRYDVQPGRTDIPGRFERFMLACSYGTSPKLLSADAVGSAMLLVPLPYRVDVRCDVISDYSNPGSQMRPLISAICEAAK